MPNLIIGLTGRLGSGKGYAAAYLERRYGGVTFKFSAYLSQALDVMALENSRDNLVKLSEALRREFGEQVLSYALAKDAVASDAPVVVVDGIRRVDDLAALEPLPNFALVAVEATPEIRFKRIAGRGEKTDEQGISYEEFMAQEQRSTEITVPTVMARASHRISNDGTVEELERAVDDLMNSLNTKS